MEAIFSTWILARCAEFIANIPECNWGKWVHYGIQFARSAQSAAS